MDCYPYGQIAAAGDRHLYAADEIDRPYHGDWLDDAAYPVKTFTQWGTMYYQKAIIAARRAFYAQCTHIDRQLRLVIGT
ncbi:MAG: hypothetical protein GY803_24870 [Chloroflexi bacterium]|nr:hypothetical protein [Chloroflexota bacterium]